MIGKIIIGKSSLGCLRYCLAKKDAEVLLYNLCYGNKEELAQQFKDVQRLNPGLSKPVEHITLSFPKGENPDHQMLENIVQDCAMDMGFDKNQYVAVIHHDTEHLHIHIVINRVGFDGKTVKDGNNYRKMSEFCRCAENKYQLQKVLNPKKFLPKEMRHLPRSDERKEKLRNDIRECLADAKNYCEFEALMIKRGYQIYKARGIAFTDEKKVRFKGSEVGYSLSKIEKILKMNSEQKTKFLTQELNNTRLKLLPKKRISRSPKQIINKPINTNQLNPSSAPPNFMKKKKRKKRHPGS